LIQLKDENKGDSMGRKTALVLGMVSLSFFLFLALGNARAAELKIGDEAPGFIVASTLDKEIDYYRDYYGKHHLILTFIANAFGPNCTDDSVGHQRNLHFYNRLNTKLLVIDRDDVGTNKQFIKAHWLEFPVGSSVTARVGQEHGVYPTQEPYPTPRFKRRTLIIDKAGIVRYIKDGSPEYKEILEFLVKLEEEFKSK
jgi:peroxiredoxin